MQQEWTGEGLIFKVGRFREIDCWVRFFSPTFGLTTAMAFGGSRSRRRFCGCLDALNSVLFKVRFFPAKGCCTLEEATLLRMFPRLRQDAARTGLAANCLSFLQALRITPEEAPVVYALLMETLEVLDQAENVSPVFLQLFRARICFDHGYAPELETCAVCGREQPEQTGKRLTLALDKGRICCARCVPGAGRNLEIGPETQVILGSLSTSRPGQWVLIPMSAATRGEIFQVVDGYVRHHLGLRWSHGRFVAA
ncbi:DNA replication and repair protein RecO [Desulfonatronum thiosulfatophilum]|uniref:DNA repair protein RecO n=1 Tax=Desulfonatronum thiosulfatophilum TaxID=617002 RepID=A0A1G6DRM3_9BACT|nr:DNA repair protein RecO [Desulfonatronum thiosulfatophilum]SDB47799.1 DNA replication and repair protein RecO [Desulfonatronum thiosulfatophilum]